MWVLSLGQEDPQEEGTATHFSIFLFFFFLATGCGMWELDSPPRDQTCAPCTSLSTFINGDDKTYHTEDAALDTVVYSFLFEILSSFFFIFYSLSLSSISYMGVLSSLFFNLDYYNIFPTDTGLNHKEQCHQSFRGLLSYSWDPKVALISVLQAKYIYIYLIFIVYSLLTGKNIIISFNHLNTHVIPSRHRWAFLVAQQLTNYFFKDMTFNSLLVSALPSFWPQICFSPSIYKEQLNTRVVLVAVETWTERDHIDITTNLVQMLHEFSKYRQRIRQRADAVHLISRVTFHYKRSSLSYFGGVCSHTRGVGVNEYGLPMAVAQVLSQSLAQNLGIQWEPSSRKPKCDCTESWGGCIMEETGVSHSRKFSKCSILEYRDFLLRGGGACLFNRPTKLFEPTECGNGYVEAGEECDCGIHVECYGLCCKKCSLSNGAHCSDGPCCNNTSCLFQPRGYECRDAVNGCDITEYCTGDSGQCPPNLHKQDGYACNQNQGRCYNGECKTRDNQCQYIWGTKASGSDKFCYEKLNTEGTEKGNCGKDGDRWIQCSKHDVFCGFLLCTNLTRAPRIGQLQGEIIPTSFYHQGRVIDCSGAHVVLDDDTDVGYVEDGTPCGPSMMCLDRKCLQIQALNMSSCPLDSKGKVCSGHGVCSNEATCICDFTWAGTDCSIRDPVRNLHPPKDEGPKGPSATNLIIGSIAGAILVAAIVLGGTGWGFKYLCPEMGQKRRNMEPQISSSARWENNKM
ncbi:hypothetical protein FD755_008116 [Muntiacus reevesi]|uniref:EGF-like domain-containing protein n=1 Tax=Muntiacus reevesi TaxID=9886 RepID=A0A5J5MLA6_MUNRE|nr:hypothetical protein FD755_008116 [Muntiacus reevesi]